MQSHSQSISISGYSSPKRPFSPALLWTFDPSSTVGLVSCLLIQRAEPVCSHSTLGSVQTPQATCLLNLSFWFPVDPRTKGQQNIQHAMLFILFILPPSLAQRADCMDDPLCSAAHIHASCSA